MTYGRQIAKNAALLMLATTGQKIVSFIAFIVVARLIGKEHTGVFFYSVSITSIFVTFADLGMTPVVIRAIAGSRDDGGRLLGAALRMKVILAPIAIVIALGYAILFGADRVTLLTVVVACGVMTADTIHLVLYGALRGRQNLRPEAIGMFIGQVLTAGASVTAAWFGYGPIGLALALLAGSLWNVLWSAIQMRACQVRISQPRKYDYWQLAREAVPFGIAGIAVKVYSYVDTLFIRQFHGAAAVGLYAAAYKLTYASQFLPLTFTAALYPALASAFAKHEKEDLRNVFFGSMRLMAAIGFPITAGLSALAPRLMPFLFGQGFAEAAPVLSILPWVIMPIFLDFPIGALLNATHKAHQKTMSMVATMVLNIALNAVLVPLFSIQGAAWAGVISFWALYAIGIWLTREYVGGVMVFIKLTLRCLLAGGISWVAWRVIGGPMNFAAAIVFGGAVAVIMAFIMGFVTINDCMMVIRRFGFARQKVEPVVEDREV